MSLSPRGHKAADSTLRVDLELFFEASDNLYHPFANSEGAIPLCVAENKLLWPMLESKLRKIARRPVPSWAAGYTSPAGHPEFRRVFAEFFSKYIAKCEIDPMSLAFASGATGIVEMSSFILASEGEVAAFPAPCYPVYRNDIGNFPGLNRHDIITHRNLDELKDGPVLSIDHLEATKQELGDKFKLLVITSPDNPTGMIYPISQLESIADWCLRNKVHLVVNEIYSLSLIENLDQGQYASFAKIMAKEKSDYLHLWYALSKDFGISGFRVGMVHTHNTEFLKAFETIGLSHCISNHTQWSLSRVLEDDLFLEQYITENKRHLRSSFEIVSKFLDEKSIPYAPAKGSLFVWADFSQFLSVWMRLYKETGVLITPGNGFGHEGFGFFRIVYSCVSQETLEVGLYRLGQFLDSSREP